MKSNRDLLTLIRMMQNFIPLEKTDIHADLNKVAASCPYQPPEGMPDMFFEASCALGLMTLEESKSLWGKIVFSIWMNERFQE